jgi:hypothetical protein
MRKNLIFFFITISCCLGPCWCLYKCWRVGTDGPAEWAGWGCVRSRPSQRTWVPPPPLFSTYRHPWRKNVYGENSRIHPAVLYTPLDEFWCKWEAMSSHLFHLGKGILVCSIFNTFYAGGIISSQTNNVSIRVQQIFFIKWRIHTLWWVQYWNLRHIY